MVKPLSFKGDKKTKKRKRADAAADRTEGGPDGTLTTTQAQKTAEEEDPENDDSWVSPRGTAEVVGPVMIVLPTEKPSALACDPSGKVFALPIENIVDGNPTSAEPHDVRQVWVVNRVAGTDKFRFKGHHGRYLACDKIGLLYATSEAISPLEVFNLVPTPNSPESFHLQSDNSTYLTATAPKSSKPTDTASIRGDADDMSAETTLRIRMQARFKPHVKTSKEEKALSKISRSQLEEAAGRRLEEDEVRRLKKARREGDYHEALLEIKVKNKHDKFS